jgi:hypothetical protein
MSNRRVKFAPEADADLRAILRYTLKTWEIGNGLSTRIASTLHSKKSRRFLISAVQTTTLLGVFGRIQSART